MARRVLLAVASATLLLSSMATADESPTPALRKKALLIGIDGCRPDAIKVARTPALDALIADGAYSDAAQTGDITVSGPGWSSMLTGVWRQKHGVVDNDFTGSRFDRYPHFFRRLKDQDKDLRLCSLTHWIPIHSKIMAGADLSLPLPYDPAVAAQGSQLLENKDPDVLFVHFDDVDGAGHKFGFSPSEPRYLDAIEKTDRHIATLIESLHKRPTYKQEDWLVLVSTDHGGSGTRHGQNIPEHRTIFLIVSGPSAQRGAIEPAPNVVDVPPTIATHLGVAIDPQWGWDGEPVGLKKAPAKDG